MSIAAVSGYQLLLLAVLLLCFRGTLLTGGLTWYLLRISMGLTWYLVPLNTCYDAGIIPSGAALFDKN